MRTLGTQNEMCRIPVSIPYRIIDGHPVEIDRVDEEIPADCIARFLIQKFGITPIVGDSNN